MSTSAAVDWIPKPNGAVAHAFHQPAKRPLLDEKALHGVAGDFVCIVAPHTEADPAAILVQFLVAIGCYIGRRARYILSRDVHHSNLFCLVVGKTGYRGRKGMSWSEISHLLRELDEQFATLNKVSGLSSGEGLIAAVKDPEYELEKIRKDGRTVDTHMVLKDPGVNDKRLLVVEPEFARTLKAAERDSSILSAVVREAYDTGNLGVLTKARTRATGAHISIIGHITPEELRTQLSSTQVANGWANRFLYVWAERSKRLPFGGNLEKDALQHVIKWLTTVREYASTLGQLEMDAGAKQVWETRYEALTPDQESPGPWRGQTGLLDSVLGRADANPSRLALIYAVLDKSDQIRRCHLDAALAIWDYCDASARFIFGDAIGDETADSILRLLRASPNGATRTDIRDHFQKNKSSEEIKRALGVLQEHGRARMENHQTEGAVRSTEVWFSI